MRFRSIALALSLATAALHRSAPARAQTIELKLSHFVPPQHAFHKWVTAWAEKIEKESGGRLKFTIYPNGQLVGPPQRQLDAARNGITDIAWVLHGVTPGRYPMTELANLPFGWKGDNADIVEMAKRMTELAPKYLAAEHTGLHILFMSMANPVVAYTKTPITKLDDFKGMKIRYASATNKVFLDALGATTCWSRRRIRRMRSPRASSRRDVPARGRPPTTLPACIMRSIQASRPRPSSWR